MEKEALIRKRKKAKELQKKYPQLISNKPEIKEGDIKHMDDFNGVNP